MNYEQLIDVLKVDNGIFVLKSQKYRFIKQQDVCRMWINNREQLIEQYIYKWLRKKNQWVHSLDNRLFALGWYGGEWSIEYEPINLDEFITEHFAELL